MSLFSMFGRTEQPPQNPIGGNIILATAKNDGTYPGSGTTWNDISGYNNNGTLSSGVTWTGPSYCAALSLGNGTTITFNPSSRSLTNITISLWQWQVAGSTQTIFQGLGFFVRKNNTGRIEATCTTQVGGSTATSTLTTSAAFTDDNWYNITLTFGNGIFTLYVANGTSAGSVATTYATLSTSNTITIYGQTSVRYVNNFNVIDRTLTRTEVGDKYNIETWIYGSCTP